MFPNYLEVEKTGSQQFRGLQILLQLFAERKKWIPAIWTKKCSSQPLGARKKIMTSIYSQKNWFTAMRSMKKFSKLFGSAKNWFLSISSLTNTVAPICREKKVDPCYFETKKCSSQLLGVKEKDYDTYLMSEKLVHSQQEHEKNVSQVFGSAKNWFLAISNLTNTVAAIWREKKVDPCYLETKKFSSQLLGARKKIMTSI